MDVVGIAGSLRTFSLNRALLRAATELAPPGMRIDVFDLVAIPLYNAEHDPTQGGGDYPDAVEDLRARVAAADAVLIVTPEYNWGPAGVTKNVIDWLSRPAGRGPLTGKPVALAGVSPGPAGTGRAQLQLRQTLLSTRSYVLQSPIVQIGGGRDRFDDNLRLADEATRDLVRQQLEALRSWTARLAAPVVEDLEIRLG